MIARVLTRFRGHAVLGALFTLGTKVGGSLSALAMFALASWTMDVAAFGELVIVFNIVSLAAVVAVLGQDTLMQRSWGEYVEHDPGLARGAVRFGTTVTLAGAILLTTGFFVWARFVDGRLTPAEASAVSAFLFSQTLLHFSSSLTRVVRGTLHSEPPRELFWRVPLVIGLAVAASTGGRTSIVAFFSVAALAQLLTVTLLAVVIAKGLPVAVRVADARHRTGEWVRRSATMTTAAMSEAAHQYADVILIGHLLGSTAAASYFVLVRIANIFSMLTSGIHNYSASKVSYLYYVGRLDDLRKLMSQIMAMTLILVVALLLLLAFEGQVVLSVFGNQYRPLQPELMMMSIVTSLATLAGPGPMLLLSMGKDLLYLKLVLGALAVRIAALVVLAPIYQLHGAILAVALAVLPLVVTVTVVCIRSLGVDPSVAAVVSGPWLRKRDGLRANAV